MNEDLLRGLLRGTPVPGAEDAERRGLLVASEAFAERSPPSRRAVLPRLVVTLSIATLLTALALSPAGAQVRGWIGDVIPGVPDAEPALTDVPGGGQLLVQAPDGPWVVQPDGSRRLLGDYAEATWSPQGLFLGATSGHALSAVEPDGDPRWSLSREAPVSEPRWSPSGFRIAYRAGRALRVVVADGSRDALLDPRVEPVPAAWLPLGPHVLAYAAAGGLRVVNADTAETLGSTAAALPGIAALGWAPDGSMLLEASRRSLRLRDVTMGKLANRLRLGPARRILLPAGVTIDAAAFSPRDATIAALLRRPGRKAGPPRGEVVLIDAADGSLQRLFSAPGRFSDLAWSPDGRRLLIAWRDADQWLFIPTSGRGRVQAVSGISEEFSPGGRRSATFPRIDGWCCAATGGAAVR